MPGTVELEPKLLRGMFGNFKIASGIPYLYAFVLNSAKMLLIAVLTRLEKNKVTSYAFVNNMFFISVSCSHFIYG